MNIITILLIIFTLYAIGVYLVIISNTTVEQRMKGAPTSDEELKRILTLAATWPLWIGRKQ